MVVVVEAEDAVALAVLADVVVVVVFDVVVFEVANVGGPAGG